MTAAHAARDESGRGESLLQAWGTHTHFRGLDFSQAVDEREMSGCMRKRVARRERDGSGETLGAHTMLGGALSGGVYCVY